MAAERFDGFGTGTRAFLADLAANNDKTWFDAHRDEYERHYLEPALAFIRAIAPRLEAISPHVHAEARVNGSLMRINRDVRFSNDKRPYKDHLDLWFWEGERRGWDAPGFFMRLTAESIVLGAGMHRMAGAQLDAFRAAVAGAKGEAAAALLARLAAAGYDLGEPTRARVPKGFDAAHPRADLLRRDGLAAMREEPWSKAVGSAKLVEYAAAQFAVLAPVNDWLREAISG